MKKIIHKIKRVLHKFARVVKWIPIIWRNAEDWDYDFLLNIMVVKLREMQHYFENGEIIEDTKEVAQEIRLLANSIERVQAQDYFDDSATLESLTKDDFQRNQDLWAADIEFMGNQFKKVVNWWD